MNFNGFKNLKISLISLMVNNSVKDKSCNGVKDKGCNSGIKTIGGTLFIKNKKVSNLGVIIF